MTADFIDIAGQDRYLARHGHPVDPDDLGRHEAVRMGNIVGSGRLALHGVGADVRGASFAGRLTVDHGLAAREALMAGRGIVATHFWLIDDLLASGAAERVLPAFEVEPVPLSILFVRARARTARVRLVNDALATLLRQVPGVESGTR